MAIQTDDMDIKMSWLYTDLGGNGDYYISIAEKGTNRITTNTIRVTTSGSRYPSEVALAVANLHRVLEEFNLNSRELNEEIEFKRHSVSAERESDQEALIKLLKSRNNKNLWPCWEMYRTINGVMALLDRNAGEWRACILPCKEEIEAKNFLKENYIPFTDLAGERYSSEK